MPKDINKNVVDRDSSVKNFFTGYYLKYIYANLNCINLGRVIKYDKYNHTCNVQLLPLQSDGNKRTPLNEVLVPKSIWQTDKAMQAIKEKISIEYQSLKVGSVVAVGFFDREIDNFSGKANYKLESDRMHALNDALVLEVI